ncbi:DUF6436 domain-containing protein [Pseudomonas sp.]|uniref:DUF6436 domain-containing protein n=1 Tax=Pseudomonas sp. TaxID=306 RepID=UPI0028A8D351|nr:DUF6436 domain-containing protein [Pseudomonas sp.]
MSPRRKIVLASLFGLLWVVALLFAIWWYQARYIRPFDNRATLFDGGSLQLPAQLTGPGPIRLVHFWDPACPCNVGNQQHLAELIERFANRGVAFYAVQKPGSQGHLPKTLQALQSLKTLPGAADLPASPAVGIWDASGRLVYFGPYSEGASCTSGNSFIEPVLEALAQGRAVNATNTLAVGCYCPWRDTTD